MAQASLVAAHFVNQYYQTFHHRRHLMYQYYRGTSIMARIDGETITDSVSGVMRIQQLFLSLDTTGIELKTIMSQESWNGGILVLVSGLMKSMGINVWRKFVQTFFLAPEAQFYFVLNDMFHIFNDEATHQAPAPVPAQEDNVGYNLPEQSEPAETNYAAMLSNAPPAVTPQRLRVAYPSPQQPQQSTPNYGSQQPQQSTPNYDEKKGVHVGNIPFTVRSLEIKKAFERFGKVLPNGVNLRDHALIKPGNSVRYAFVEFEDVASAHKAIEEKSITLDNGRVVYIAPIRRGTLYHRGEGSKGYVGKKLLYYD